MTAVSAPVSSTAGSYAVGAGRSSCCAPTTRGGNLAHNHGLGCREVAGVLREMAAEGRTTPAVAHYYYFRAMTVSRPRARNQSRPPEDFR